MFQLIGPFPFDYTAVTASGRTALGKVGQAIREDKLEQLLMSIAPLTGAAAEAAQASGGQTFQRDMLEQLTGVGTTLSQSATDAARLGAEAVGLLDDTVTERQPRVSTPLYREILADQPGLYVMLTGPDLKGMAIEGFWLVFGANYLDEGTLGPPDRHPPYAMGLLDAATEEVWWRTLRVASDVPGHWRPVIVMEWPEALAVRSGLAPPGTPGAGGDEGGGGGAGEDGVWLDELEPDIVDSWDDDDTPKAPRRKVYGSAATAAAAGRRGAGGARRSILAVVRGDLNFDRLLHKGNFSLAQLSELVEPGPDGSIPMDQWLEVVKTGPVVEGELPPPPPGAPDDHGLSLPLALPGNRVGYAGTGWLTRGLDVWPPRPSNVHGAALTARVVRTKWKGQLMQAAAAMVTVLTLVLSLAIGVRLAAEPHPQPMKVTPPPAAQPAMSVCSADHQPFVDEFRCQIEYLAATNEPFPAGKVCRDGGGAPVPTNGKDLQAAYCGLLDREEDNWKGNRQESDRTWNFAHLAASQACFNVLGQPYKYAQSRRTDGFAVADPSRFLEDEALGINPLQKLTEDLKGACESYRTRVEGRIEGAVFATHIGGPMAEDYLTDSEPSALRRLVVEQAVASMGNDATRCFQAGVDAGLAGQTYDSLCGEPDPLDKKHNNKKIWKLLRGSGPSAEDPDVVTRYMKARFGLGSPDGIPVAVNTNSELWQCHLTLSGVMPSRVQPVVATLWDLSMPVPKGYNVRGSGLMTQLLFDAAMRKMSDGLDAGVCWGLVRKRLNAYTPVHPLLGEVDDAGWPSVEQQICGQVCAVAFNVASLPEGAKWVTPSSDLDSCVYQGPPGDNPFMGRSYLDSLRLPWNGRKCHASDPKCECPTSNPRCKEKIPENPQEAARYVDPGWVWLAMPSTADVCAFNLISQDYLPAEKGYIPGAKAPVQWAGETGSGSGIAGGPDGLVTMAIEGMHRYGTGSSWSKGPCSYVATQCFTSLLTEVTGPQGKGKKSIEPYEWTDRWTAKVRELSNTSARDLSTSHPWCAPLQPYLGATQAMAQFDEPCRQGVEEARENVKLALATLATRGGQ